ncbi:MAG: HNH endonuclease, partial [Catalinimonas sp.]
AMHDRAFDKGFITVTSELKVKVSKRLEDFEGDEAIKTFFIKYENQEIIKPERFLPRKRFLDYHHSEVFLR